VVQAKVVNPVVSLSIPYNNGNVIRANKWLRPEGLQVFLNTFNFVRTRSVRWPGPFF